ncbi:MAG TPA: hypothetical protein QGG59_03980 [Planctomycetota bacterium]|jgi:hypothetical protein|nr:hypothetical protein [Planctomycetota bacterium]HJM39258.1 hypothetical protein [Planctomycetota bacterium]|tara:strand:- start:776 stop:1102 length:327 start_codon:yes stop_codon:yes gene_type:complete
MHKKIVAIVLIAAFLAQSAHAGVHLLEPVPPQHDCGQHGAGDFGAADEVDHPTCLICQNIAGKFGFLPLPVNSIGHSPTALRAIKQQVCNSCIEGLGVCFVRGPPVWV